VTDIVTGILWLARSAFTLLAAIGVLRMPDVFTRMQASTTASTLGLACLLIGAALQGGDWASFIRIASIGAFVLLTSAVSAHVIAPRRTSQVSRCGRALCSMSGEIRNPDAGTTSPAVSTIQAISCTTREADI
jgi:multicomponent Na+:H+ antiporter subunit G